MRHQYKCDRYEINIDHTWAVVVGPLYSSIGGLTNGLMHLMSHAVLWCHGMYQLYVYHQHPVVRACTQRVAARMQTDSHPTFCPLKKDFDTGNFTNLRAILEVKQAIENNK